MAQLFDGQLRFGVHAGPQHTGYADYLRLWREVEALGYDWASVFDHFIPIQSDPTGPCFEGPTLLAALAAETSRVRCGLLVAGNTYRHPAVLAKIAATLDHVAGGRLEWGMGAGWWELEHQQYHLPFHTAARRIRMLGEAARIQKLLWTEPRASFAGRYYRLTDALCEPKPVQQRLPLWIGGLGERLTLRVVAEVADGWNAFFMPLDAYRHKLAVLAEHCAAVGRDPRDIRKSLLAGVVLGATAEEAQARAAAAARALDVPPEALRDRLLIGTPEEVAARLLDYVALGVGDVLLAARAPFDYTTLRLFIERVAPLVRRGATALPDPGG